MARVQRGTRPIKRKNAKNFIQRQAQSRLDEAVDPFNKQVENSLFVNAVEVDYYQSVERIGKPCTCEKVEISDEHKESVNIHSSGDTDHVAAILPTPNDDNAGVNIRLQDPDLFGDSEAEKMYGDSSIEITGLGIERDDDDIPAALYEEIDPDKPEANSAYEESIVFGGVANCGVCYRAGFQPGHRAYGKQRTLLTTWDIVDMEGYMVRTSDTPHSFVKQGDPKTSFVEFSIEVPKYFAKCVVSIRNNLEILQDKLYLEAYPLSMDILKRYAGRTLHLKVYAENFTHAVVEFDLGLEKLRANLGLESHTLDYARLEAIENFPVVLPPKVHDVSIGDLIIVQKRGLVLKVTDKERKITADKRQLEWMLQTRLIQKNEPVRLIAKGTKIL